MLPPVTCRRGVRRSDALKPLFPAGESDIDGFLVGGASLKPEVSPSLAPSQIVDDRVD